MIDQLLWNWVLPALLVLATPFIGGILAGIDRKLTARMQSRIGPPLTQPFYDVFKLWRKRPFIASILQPTLAVGYLGFAMVAMALLAFRQDLLLILFTASVADICLIIASFNSKSPYSYLGGKRELLLMLSYEPVILIAFVSIYLITGSFLVEEIFRFGISLLSLLPATFLALGLVLLLEMRKSPFDVSASTHAHQELVRGVYTEFSGYTMAIVEVGHWVKIVLMLSLLSLFWHSNMLIGGGLALLTFFIALVIDNSYPRLTWQATLKITWGIGFSLITANILGLLLAGVIST